MNRSNFFQKLLVRLYKNACAHVRMHALQSMHEVIVTSMPQNIYGSRGNDFSN